MSDIGIDIPFPILLALAGAVYWPVTLVIALAFGAVAVFVKRWWVRVIGLVVAALLAADCLLALWLPGD